MISPVFLATLGQRPEAITMALDVLLPRYHYSQIGILHTDPHNAMIADAYKTLMTVLHEDYSDCDISSHELRNRDDTPISDLMDTYSAESYFYSLASVLWTFRQQYRPVHLLVSGGRKAMSIYATIAATHLFGEHDRVWVILTQPQYMQEGVFHLKPGEHDGVHLVNLPLIPSSMLPGAMQNLPTILSPASPREKFLSRLTSAETALTETLRQHAYASNEDLALILGKSRRTVEYQLQSVYKKCLFSLTLTHSVQPESEQY